MSTLHLTSRSLSDRGREETGGMDLSLFQWSGLPRKSLDLHQRLSWPDAHTKRKKNWDEQGRDRFIKKWIKLVKFHRITFLQFLPHPVSP